MRGLPQIVSVYAEQLIAALQFATHIGGATGKDERHKDALAILAADNVETETGGALLDGDRTCVPEVARMCTM